MLMVKKSLAVQRPRAITLAWDVDSYGWNTLWYQNTLVGPWREYVTLYHYNTNLCMVTVPMTNSQRFFRVENVSWKMGVAE